MHFHQSTVLTYSTQVGNSKQMQRELEIPANKQHRMLNQSINPESDAATTEVEAALCVRELDSRILRFESK